MIAEYLSRAIARARGSKNMFREREDMKRWRRKFTMLRTMVQTQSTSLSLPTKFTTVRTSSPISFVWKGARILHRINICWENCKLLIPDRTRNGRFNDIWGLEDSMTSFFFISRHFLYLIPSVSSHLFFRRFFRVTLSSFERGSERVNTTSFFIIKMTVSKTLSYIICAVLMSL